MPFRVVLVFVLVVNSVHPDKFNVLVTFALGLRLVGTANGSAIL